MTVYFEATHRELQGFARMRTTTTLSILVRSIPREVLQSMDVRVPTGWVGPHVDDLAEAAGDGFSYY